MLAWAGGEGLKNWAGNLEYSTERVYTPTSLEQVKAYVKKENRLRCSARVIASTILPIARTASYR